MITSSMSHTEYQKAGERIADLIGLKLGKDGYYKTTWGTKTAAGLAMCVERCLVESQTLKLEDVLDTDTGIVL